MKDEILPNRHADGMMFEEIALQYLLKRGYRLLRRNFRLGRLGEIDLIMRDGTVHVFVEVKGRRTHGYGLPEDAVTTAKRKQIRKIAGGYIHVTKLTNYEARFDVVAIDFATGNEDGPEIRHHRDAF